MAVVAAAPKIELTPNQAWSILTTLELLDRAEHKNDKLIYTPISIRLDNRWGWVRGCSETYNSWTGGEETPNMEALPRLIQKVHDCITKNASIIDQQSERSTYTVQIPKALKGLETLKKNQYNDQSKKEAEIDKAIESLKSAKAALEKKHEAWVSTQLQEYKARSAQESQQKDKDARIAQLEAEIKELEAQLAAKEVLGSASFEGIPKKRICETIRLLATYLEQAKD